MSDKFKRKNLHFFFKHNLNNNIKIVNPDNSISNRIEVKERRFFANFSEKNLIKKVLIDAPIIQNNNNNKFCNNINLTNRDINNIIDNQSIESNKDIMLNQISEIIDKKTKNKNKENIININNITFFNILIFILFCSILFSCS